MGCRRIIGRKIDVLNGSLEADKSSFNTKPISHQNTLDKFLAVAAGGDGGGARTATPLACEPVPAPPPPPPPDTFDDTDTFDLLCAEAAAAYDTQ